MSEQMKTLIDRTVFGLGVWHKGEIDGHPALKEAYDMGKNL